MPKFNYHVLMTGQNQTIEIPADWHCVDDGRLTIYQDIEGALGLEWVDQVASFKLPDYWWREPTRE